MAAPPPTPPQVILVGNRRHPLRDLYHAFLLRSWWLLLAVIAGGFLVFNAVFAVAYRIAGGIVNARTLADCFFFSVQTSGTIGYGAMYPASRAAHALVVAEAVVSLIFTAVATGLVFAKFSRTPARLRFSRHAVVGLHDGRSTLMIRLGNERGSAIVETRIHVTLSRTETTTEGERFYRMLDLALTRERAPALSRSWTVMHVIGADSPLAGADAAVMAAWDAELVVTVNGLDGVTLLPVHGSYTYDHSELAWGMRHADILREEPGRFIVDLSRFDDVEPSPLPGGGPAVTSRS